MVVEKIELLKVIIYVKEIVFLLFGGEVIIKFFLASRYSAHPKFSLWSLVIWIKSVVELLYAASRLQVFA